jgi:hypothetical protein
MFTSPAAALEWCIIMQYAELLPDGWFRFRTPPALTLRDPERRAAAFKLLHAASRAREVPVGRDRQEVQYSLRLPRTVVRTDAQFAELLRDIGVPVTHASVVERDANPLHAADVTLNLPTGKLCLSLRAERPWEAIWTPT